MEQEKGERRREEGRGGGRREGRFWRRCPVTDTRASALACSRSLGEPDLGLRDTLILPSTPATLTFLSHFTAETLELPAGR